MKSKRKYRTLGLVEPKRLSSFDWKKAITIISPDERLDTGSGLPPVKNQSKNEGKIYAKAITILWHEGNGKYNDAVFDSGKSLFEAFEAIYRYEIDNILEMGEDPLDMAYSKMKLKVLFMDGEQDEFRADVSPVEFNPYNFRSLHEFVVAAYGSAVDPNYVYNFMGFVNPNYQNEPKWKPNPEAVARKKAEDEKKANSFRFEGANYRKTADLSREELIKVIREAFAEKYPYAKLSVRQDNRGTGTGSIDVKILDIGFNPFNDEFKTWLKEGNTTYGRPRFREVKRFQMVKFLESVVRYLFG